MGIFMLIGTALCAMACLAETSAQADGDWEAKRAAIKNRPRPLILNSDGNEVVYAAARSRPSRTVRGAPASG